jgi:hypothetical protein
MQQERYVWRRAVWTATAYNCRVAASRIGTNATAMRGSTALVMMPSQSRAIYRSGEGCRAVPL